MKLEPTKQSKRLRIATCVLFVIQLFLCSSNYVTVFNGETGESISFTVLHMLLWFNGETYQELYNVAALSSIFAIIPLIGFLFAAFDKMRPVKFAVGIICSIAGATAITVLIGPMLATGSLFALLLYVVTLFVSVLGLFSRYIKQPETETKQDKQDKTA